MNNVLFYFLIWYGIGLISYIICDIIDGKIRIVDVLWTFLYSLLGPIVTLIVIIKIIQVKVDLDTVIWRRRK